MTLLPLIGIFPWLAGAGGVPFAFFAIYLVLRWRDRDDSVHDPHVGLKAVLLSIETYSLLLALGGATVVVDWGLRKVVFGGESDKNEFAAGLGFSLAGTLAVLVVTLGLRRTNAAEFPRASRMFRGFLGVFSALIAVTSLALAVSALFTGQKGTALSLPWAAELVWAAAAWKLVRSLTLVAPRRPGGDLAAAASGKAAGTP